MIRPVAPEELAPLDRGALVPVQTVSLANVTAFQTMREEFLM